MLTTINLATAVRRLRLLPVLACLSVSACAGLDRNDQGLLQPQTVAGPCQVKKFYILSVTAVHTAMTVGNTGQGCRFTIFNPDQQVVLTAALVTEPALHGRATAGLVTLGRQGEVSYTPQPGYVGPDQFTVTFEPHALSIAVAVTVQPTPPAS